MGLSDQARTSGAWHSALSTQHSALFFRFLVLAAFAFWVGGFTFYAAVVVPTGTEVLGGAAEQKKGERRQKP